MGDRWVGFRPDRPPSAMLSTDTERSYPFFRKVEKTFPGPACQIVSDLLENQELGPLSALGTRIAPNGSQGETGQQPADTRGVSGIDRARALESQPGSQKPEVDNQKWHSGTTAPVDSGAKTDSSAVGKLGHLDSGPWLVEMPIAAGTPPGESAGLSGIKSLTAAGLR